MFWHFILTVAFICTQRRKYQAHRSQNNQVKETLKEAGKITNNSLHNVDFFKFLSNRFFISWAWERCLMFTESFTFNGLSIFKTFNHDTTLDHHASHSGSNLLRVCYKLLKMLLDTHDIKWWGWDGWCLGLLTSPRLILCPPPDTDHVVTGHCHHVHIVMATGNLKCI